MDSKKLHEIEIAYQERAKTLFVQENIGAIIYYLNKQIPNIFPLVKGNEFETITHSAQIDGMKKLVELVQTSVLGNKRK